MFKYFLWECDIFYVDDLKVWETSTYISVIVNKSYENTKPKNVCLTLCRPSVPLKLLVPSET